MMTTSPPPRRKWHLARWFFVLIIAVFGWSGWRAYAFRSARSQARALGWAVRYADPVETIWKNWKAVFKKETWLDGGSYVGMQTSEEKFREPLRDAKNLWNSMNTSPAPSGITLPVTINEGTQNQPALVTQAQFVAAMTELQGLYEARAQARHDLKTARARRDETIRFIYAVLVSYRTAVLPRISTNQPLIDTLPRLSPEGGHTPEPVTVQATLTAPDTATGTHSESNEATFAQYEVLAAAGEDAELDDAVVLFTRTNRTPEPFTVTLGLAEPGGAVSIWVRVVLESGNEKTSQRVVVQRPD